MSAVAAGDVDGDGRSDLVIAELNPFSFLKGVIWVYSGATGAVLHKISGDATSAMLGWRVVAVGDVDRDGRADFGATDPGDASSGRPTGALTVWSGRTGQVLHKLTGSPGSQFGMGAGTVGDLSGDGQPELIVGMPASSRLELWTLGDVAAFGRGCSSLALSPTLRTTEARLNTDLSVFLHGATPTRPAALLVSTLAPAPTPLDAACTAYVGTDAELLVFGSTDSTGSFARTFPLPGDRSLRGRSFAFQTAIAGTASPPAARSLERRLRHRPLNARGPNGGGQTVPGVPARQQIAQGLGAVLGARRLNLLDHRGLECRTLHRTKHADRHRHRGFVHLRERHRRRDVRRTLVPHHRVPRLIGSQHFGLEIAAEPNTERRLVSPESDRFAMLQLDDPILTHGLVGEALERARRR